MGIPGRRHTRLDPPRTYSHFAWAILSTHRGEIPHAFPSDRAALEASPHVDGRALFGIARQALLDLVPYNPGYANAARNPDKFMHAFGIFQYDIQFSLSDPDFFLQRQWSSFERCLSLFLDEVEGVNQALYGGRAVLMEEESCYVAVGYNVGSRKVKLTEDFRPQGHDGYGEKVFGYLKLAETIGDAAGSLL